MRQVRRVPLMRRATTAASAPIHMRWKARPRPSRSPALRANTEKDPHMTTPTSAAAAPATGRRTTGAARSVAGTVRRYAVAAPLWSVF